MSRDDENDYDDLYVDDVDMLELNQVLPSTGARATMEEDAMSKAVGDKLYGPTGRGSPEMRNISPYELSRYAGKALRYEGIKDDRHLKNTKAWHPRSEQQQKEEADERRFDEAISNMYIKMRKPVKSAARPMSKYKLPPSKRKGGGTRKRNKRSTCRRVSRKRSRRNKRSRNKRSRR